MCTLLFAYRTHPKYALVMAANRDEFYARATTSAHFWEGTTLLAGQDQAAGGTWMGITRAGRFAAITNYRDLSNIRADAPSRGALTRDFLLGEMTPEAYMQALQPTKAQYNGFNLVVGNLKDPTQGLWYLSNYGPAPTALTPALYGLSNAQLDTPWPKVVKGKAELAQALQANETLKPDTLLALLNDTRPAPDDELPDTGVGLARERMLSAICITSSEYGSCCSTILQVGYDGSVHFVERPLNPLHPERLRVELGFQLSA